MENEDILNKRKNELKNKILKRFKTPYDLIALIVILATGIFRYYLLFKSKGQALWWDEASYLVMARCWVLDVYCYPEPIRDYAVSMFWAPLIKIGVNEFGLRFITVFAGIITFYFLYILISYFFGKKIGLVSIILTSFFYEHIFWSLRLDIGTYSILFMLISFVSYFKGIETKKYRYYILAGILAVFSLQAHAAGVFVVLVYLVFIPIQTKFKFFKSKYFWTFFIAFIIASAPFILYNLIATGQVYPRFQGGWVDRGVIGHTFSQSLVYARTLPRVIGDLSFYLFLLGFFISLEIFLIADKLFKHKISKENLGIIFFIIFGLISLSLGIYSMMGAGGAIYEPRYIIPFYFATLIFASKGILFIAGLIEKHSKSKLITIIFLIIIISFIAYPQLKQTYNLVELKKQSYQGIKQAGLWLEANSLSDDKVMSFEAPQIVYYSGRKTIGINPVIEKVEEDLFIEEPDYFLIWIGAGQKRITELMELIQENNESIFPIAGFPAGAQQPTVVLYQIDDSLYGKNNNLLEKTTANSEIQNITIP